MIWSILLLSGVVVFIVDLSGIIPSLKNYIRRRYFPLLTSADINLKPLDCSLCLTFWVGTIFLITENAFTLPLFAFVCLMAYLSKQTANLLRVIEMNINKLIDKML